MTSTAHEQQRTTAASDAEYTSAETTETIAEQRESPSREEGDSFKPDTQAGDGFTPIDTGSKEWSDFQKDKYQYDYFPSFPYTSTARSTFYAREADDEEWFNRVWKYQHDRGQTPEGWDNRVRPETVDKHRDAATILSRAEVRGFPQKEALRMVMSENLNGFNRHYAVSEERPSGSQLSLGSLI